MLQNEIVSKFILSAVWQERDDECDQNKDEASLISTRMHSSRMRTARSLTVSRCILCTQPPPQENHTPPRKKPRMPPPEKTMHAPQQKPCMPPSQKNYACPRANTHAPPGATTHNPPINRITDRCKNITFANYVCGR